MTPRISPPAHRRERGPPWRMYDTYLRYLRALKNWREGQLNLALGETRDALIVTWPDRVFREISSFRQSRNKLNMLSLFSVSIFERIVRLVAFDSSASTLLMVWTGLKAYEPETSRLVEMFA